MRAASSFQRLDHQLQGLVQVAHPAFADRRPQRVFHAPQHAQAVHQRAEAAPRKPDALGAAIVRVVDLVDHPKLFEIVNQLADGLLGDTDACSQVRQANAVEIQVRKQRRVGRPDAGARAGRLRGLARKHPDLRIDSALLDGFDEIPIEGFRPRDTAVLHRASGTLIVADLVQNVGRPEHGWTALYARAMGFYDRVALSRAIRWTGFDDRRAAGRALDWILALEFDRLVVGHGAPLSTGGHAALAAAYAWLRPGS